MQYCMLYLALALYHPFILLFLKLFISILQRMNRSGSKQQVCVATRQPVFSLLKNIHSAFFTLSWHDSKFPSIRWSFLLVCLPLQWLQLIWSLQLCTYWWPIPGFYHHVHCANCILLEVIPTWRLESHTSSHSICKYLATLVSKSDVDLLLCTACICFMFQWNVYWHLCKFVLFLIIDNTWQAVEQSCGYNRAQEI